MDSKIVHMGLWASRKKMNTILTNYLYVNLYILKAV